MLEFLKQNGENGSMFSVIVLFGGMFAIMYFVLIRPQQKQQKQHQDLINSLKKGDDVLLNSGIVGKILSIEDRYVILEVLDKNKLKVLKYSVQALLASEIKNEK